MPTKPGINALFGAFLGTFVLSSPAALADREQYLDQVAQTYGTLPTVTQMRISPQGDEIAFRRVEGDQDLALVYSLTEGETLRALDLSGILPRSMHFVSDDHLVMVVSEVRRIRGYRGEHDISNAHSLNIKTGEVNNLLQPGQEVRGRYRLSIQTGLGRVKGLSEDQQKLFMPAHVKRSRGRPNREYALLEVYLDGNRRPGRISRGSRHTIDYFMGPDDEPLAREDFNNAANTHSILIHDGSRWNVIYEEDTEIPQMGVMGVTAGRDSLVVLRTDVETGLDSYYILSLEDGELEQLPFEGQNADIEGVVMDVNRVVYGVSFSGYTPSQRFFDPELDQRVREIREQNPGLSLNLIDWSSDWSSLLFHAEGAVSSGEFVLSRPDQPLMRLSTTRPDIPSEQVHPVISLSYEARDGLEIPALLTIPRTRAEDPSNLPLIVLPHGGPEVYDRMGFHWMAQAFAELGYAVIQPQFRGSAGFGLEHRLAGHGQWGLKMQDDLTDALNFLGEAGIADPERACIVGSSYGGYAALAGAALTPDVFQCAVSINGLSDVRRFIDQRRRDYGRDHWIAAHFGQLAALQDTSRERYDAISPIYSVEDIKIPVLLIHGEHDQVVPIEQSERMYRAMRRADKDVEYLELEGENHYLSHNDTRRKTLHSILSFVDRHLQAGGESAD